MKNTKSPSEQLKDKLVSLQQSESRKTKREFNEAEFSKSAHEVKRTFENEDTKQPQSC